jgi:hypothetical protein
MDEVSTGSGPGSARGVVDATGSSIHVMVEFDGTMTRSLPLPVLTSSIVIALDAYPTGRYRLNLHDSG